VLAAAPTATILRPSWCSALRINSPNRFAALAQNLAGAAADRRRVTKLQPVYVSDVATAVAGAVDGKTKQGAIYELGGPEVLTMREIMEIILRIPGAGACCFAAVRAGKTSSVVAAVRAGPLKLTPDQVVLLQSDNVVSPAAKAAELTLEGLGITPDSLEAIAPQYLWRFRRTGQFQHKGA